MKYIISSVITLIITVSAYMYFNGLMSAPYELPDDPAWDCGNAHILAECAGIDELKKRKALVLREDGSRSWTKVLELPRYYKLKTVDTSAVALISDESVRQAVIGRTLSEIEDNLASAFELNGNKVIFPVKVLKRDSAVSSPCIEVEFKDSVAVSVEYSLELDDDAETYSMIPGLFIFIDRGIKAPQCAGYASCEKTDVKRDYRFGDYTVELVSVLLKLAFFAVVFVILLAVPFIAALPVLLLYCDNFINRWISVPLGLAAEAFSLYASLLVYVIFDGPSLIIPFISIAVCALLTLKFFIIFK